MRLAVNLLLWLWWIVRLPFMLTGDIMLRLWRKAVRRRRMLRHLVQGMPALFLGGGVISLTVIARATPADQLVERYKTEVSRANWAKDSKTAEVCYERLIVLDGERPQYLYGLGLTAERSGQMDRAEAIMMKLAPTDRQGYAGAHFWLANRLLGEPGRTAQAIQLAEIHLKWVLRQQPDAAAAHSLLAQIYLSAGQIDLAVPHLTVAAETQPDLRLVLAGVFRSRGNEEQARLHAERAMRAFRTRVQDSPQDHTARWYWAKSLLFLKDFPGATAILTDGWRMNPQVQPYGNALAIAYCEWASSLKTDQNPNWENRLKLIQQALQYDPACPQGLSALVEIGQGSARDADQVRVLLQNTLARGQAPGLVHLALAQLAWPRGEVESAQHHLEQAYRQVPTMGMVVNNLAWVLAHSDPPDLSRALALIDSNVARWPNDRHYHGTRGHIFVKLGRWAEALTDLETALPATPDNPDLHKTIAEVYEQLGLSEEASQHRRMADQGSK